MLAIKDLYPHRPSAIDQTAYALMHPTKKSIGGIVILVLVVAGIYWMLPEIRRYIRLERM